jgi:hypothetical protein
MQSKSERTEKTNESLSWCHPRPLPAHIACSESALNAHCAVQPRCALFPLNHALASLAAAAFCSPISIRRFRTRVEDYTKSHAASHSVTLHLLAAFWHRPCHGTRIWSYCTPRLQNLAPQCRVYFGESWDLDSIGIGTGNGEAFFFTNRS